MMDMREDDAHLMVARLHRIALLRLSRASGCHFQGLAMAAKHLQLSSNWKRKARELDATLGLVEKISPMSMQVWMGKLEDELLRVGARTARESGQEENRKEEDVTIEEEATLAGSEEQKVGVGTILIKEDISAAGLYSKKEDESEEENVGDGTILNKEDNSAGGLCSNSCSAAGFWQRSVAGDGPGEGVNDGSIKSAAGFCERLCGGTEKMEDSSCEDLKVEVVAAGPLKTVEDCPKCKLLTEAYRKEKMKHMELVKAHFDSIVTSHDIELDKIQRECKSATDKLMGELHIKNRQIGELLTMIKGLRDAG